MFAIFLNGFGICLGGLLGYFFKNHSSSKLSRAIIIVMGLQIFAMGIKDAVQYENGMLNVIYLVIGTVIGEAVDIDKKLKSMALLLQNKLAKNGHGFVNGFITAILIFCIGSMAILGPLKIALEKDSSIIYIKTILDGVMAMLLASTYGLGVLLTGLAFTLIFEKTEIKISNMLPAMIIPVLAAVVKNIFV